MLPSKRIFIFLLLGCLLIGGSAMDQKEFDELYDIILMPNVSADMIRKTMDKLVLAIMNPSADPCEDFYEFSCGNWRNVTQGNQGFVSLVQKKVYSTLKNILLEDIVEIADSEMEESYFSDYTALRQLSSAEISAKNYYKSCMNVQNIRENGLQDAKDFIASFGEWKTDQDMECDWVELMGNLQTMGQNVFLRKYMFFNYISYPFFTPRIAPGDIIINRKLLSDNNLAVRLQAISDYKRFVESILKLFDVNEKSVMVLTNDIVHTELMLAGIPKSVQPPADCTEVSLNTLQENYTRIDWKRYFAIVQNTTNFKDDDDNIILCELEYQTYLNEILMQKSDSSIWNYLMYRMAYMLLPYIDNSSIDLREKFNVPLEDRSEFCFSVLKSEMSAVMDTLLLRKYFRKSVLTDLGKMITDIDDQFAIIVNRSTILDDLAKHFIIDKASNMSFGLGVEDKNFLIDKLETFFAGLQITDSKFGIQNMVTLQKYLFQTNQELIGQKKKYDGNGLNFIAYYNRGGANRQFSTATLLPLTYHEHFPGWMKYSRLGAIAGHELIHGFALSDILRQTDYRRTMPYKLGTLINLFGQAVCLARHYNSIPIDGTPYTVNGIKTLSENTADLGGIHIAYAAYKKWINENIEFSSDEKIEGFDLNPDQLYFVNFVQLFCESREHSLNDPHSPKNVRGPTVLKLFPEFAKAFQCPSDSPMNPVKKCNFFN